MECVFIHSFVQIEGKIAPAMSVLSHEAKWTLPLNGPSTGQNLDRGCGYGLDYMFVMMGMGRSRS